ncbi:hypothetical protein Holit_01889 [Hollandina sp. SP2]
MPQDPSSAQSLPGDCAIVPKTIIVAKIKAAIPAISDLYCFMVDVCLFVVAAKRSLAGIGCLPNGTTFITAPKVVDYDKSTGIIVQL